MVKKIIIAGLSALLLSACSGNKTDKMTLIWADEFEYTGSPADSVWSFEEGYIRNREMQKYTSAPGNVWVEDGVCTITCRMEADSTITSASINTKGKKDILHGRVEVRAKIPSALGTWPAIWMLGRNIREVGWPACGELDIMEHVGYDPDKIHANIHTKAYNHVKGTNKGNTIDTEAPWEDFHVYAMDWHKDHIDFFYDDSLYFTYENDGMEDADTWPFDKPHYLLINFAFGGSWGGSRGVDLAALPLEYKIDYVRVYELK